MDGKLYLVGGALRDEILGKPISDKDYCVCGIDRKEFIKTLKDVGKRIWISAACTELLFSLPATLWLIFLILGPWDVYTSLVTAIALSVVVMTIAWLSLQFAWILKYGFKKEAVS